MMEPCVWMHLIDGNQRTQLHGCAHKVSILYPALLKLIEDLVDNKPKSNALDESAASAPPPGRFVFNTGSRTSNDPPPGL